MYSLNRAVTVFLLVGLVFICGCEQKASESGNANQNPHELKASDGSGQRGYLFADTYKILFIRWTEINKKLNGQLQLFYAKGDKEWRTGASSHPFEGVSDGENVSINFKGSIWTERLSGKTWTGTLKNNELRLVIPTPDGTLETVNLKPGTVDDYNQAVFSLKRNVTETNAQMQKERTEAAKIATEQRAVVDANEQVENSIRRVASAVGKLERATRFDDVLNGYLKDLEKMKAHYQEMRNKAAKRPLDSYQLSTVEYALNTLNYDLSSVEYRGSSMKYRTDEVEKVINEAKGEMSRLQKAWGNLQNAVASNSVGTPEAKFAQNEILHPINMAEEQISRALAAMQNAAKQSAAYEDQAKDLYKTAESFVKGLKQPGQ